MKLLFLCTGNSCRSQMAEGYARRLLPADWDIYSAGIVAHGMNPHMLTVMAEAGVDVSNQYSKTVEQVPWESMDLIITLCDHAAGSCPALPTTARSMHWGFPDPYLATGSTDEQLAVYRTVRDAIADRIADFAEALNHPA